MRLFFKSISLLILLVLCSISSFAQTIEDKLKEADDYFEKGLYIEAEKLYSQVLPTKPRDYDLNFKYGTCLLFSSHDKTKAISHLQHAVKSPSIDKRAYFFMGRAYHLNYQFKEAEKYYLMFRDQASSGQLKDHDVEAMLNGCKFGRKLLSNITDMIVMEKKEINEGSFYDLYDQIKLNGSINPTDQFGTKYDKKMGHRAVIFFPKNSPNIFFSSYGDDGATGLDIYQMKRLPNGKFSLPGKVRGQVNTDKDEAYAYMHPNGKYLYFCSKGHNSMGGYDVFRSVYDPKTDSFGPPENLDFAISSPDDDLLYVVDSLDRTAFFASRRESQDGKLFVYEVRVERLKMQIAAIKGSFVNTIVPSNKEVNIEIEDFSSGTQIGSFNSKSTNGDYFITFPKGGKYKYFITVKGSDVTHYAVVEVPLLQELRPLKQKISLLRDDAGEQYVKIENLFDEAFEDPVTVMAEIYKELSKLQPNAENFNLDSLNAQGAVDQIFVENGLNSFSTQDEVEKTVADKVEDLKEDQKENQENANIAYNLASEKSDQANEKMLQLNKLLDEAENATDPAEKKRLFEEVYDLKNEIEDLNSDAQNLIELGNELDKDAIENGLEVLQAEKVLNEIKEVPDGDKNALANAVNANGDFFKDQIKDKTVAPDLLEEIIAAGNEDTKASSKLNSEIIGLKNDKKTAEQNKKILEDKLANTKKSKDKEIIEDQILEIESELSTINDQINKKQNDYDKIVSGGGNDKAHLVRVADEVGDDKYDNSAYAEELSDEKKDGIKSKVEGNDLTANLEVVTETLKDNGAGSKVDLFASDEKRNNYGLDAWTEDIDKEIKNLQDELNTASPERKKRILEEIQEFENLKDQKRNEYEVVEVDPKDINSDVNKNEIVDDYETRKNQINEITDEGDRVNANLKLNQELLDEIQDEKRRLNEILDDNPDADNVRDRLNNLNEIEDDLNNEINKDKQWLTDNGQKDNVQILAEYDDDYQNKINQIYEIDDDTERNNAIRDLNGQIIDRTNERIQEINAILENDPNNENAKKELEELTEFRDGIESNQDKPLLDPVNIDLENLSTKVDADQLIPGYEDQLKEINDIEDEFDRRKAQNELYERLLSKARSEIKQLNKLADENPGNKDIKKRIEGLKKLDDKVNSDIVENEDWMRNNPKTSVSDIVADVNDINPQYKNRMNEINDIEDDNDKTKAIQELNDETLNAIETRLNVIDKTLKDDPNNPNFRELEDEKAELTNLKNQIKDDPKTPLVQTEDVTDIEVSPSVDDILPNYQSQMNTIENMETEEINREKDKVVLNKRLINKIDQEIDRLNELKSENPDLTDKIDQRIDALNTIKGIKESDIAISEDKIKSLDTSAGTTEVNLNEIVAVEDIDPDYNAKMSEINGRDGDELGKEKDKAALNKDFISKIDREIEKLNTYKAENPDQSGKVDKRVEGLNNLKKAKESELELSQDRIEELSTTAGSNEVNLNEIVDVEDIDPDYNAAISEINNGGGDELSQEENKIRANDELISKIDREIEKLNQFKTANPDQSDQVDRRIEALNDLKQDKEAENDVSENRVKELNEQAGNPDVNEVFINEFVNVEEIDPEYNTRISEINNSSDSELEKEKNKVAANQGLIAKIDSEINKLNNLRSEKPDLSDKIDKRLEGLNELKNDKNAEIDISKARIDELSDTAVGPTTNPIDLSAINETATIPEIDPAYENDLDNINLALQDDVEKAKNRIALHNRLISKIEKEIDELNTLKADNPDAADKIDKRIESLNGIKRDVQEDLAEAQTIVDAAEGQRDPITIATLMPNYEGDMAEIKSSTAITEKDRLEGENNLNGQLINKIDYKIGDLQEELEENPVQADKIVEEIEKLEELKESKRSEIARNKEVLAKLGADSDTASNNKSVGQLNPEDFATEEGQEVLANNEKNINEINEISSEIDELNEQLEATDDPKDRAKLEGEIQKRTLKMARVENEVLEDLADVNKKEFQNEKDQIGSDADVATANNPDDADVIDANRKLKEAEVLMVEAEDLRNQAEDEKDPVKANELLNEANQKENEAKTKTDQAKRIFKTARVIDSFNKGSEEVVTEVPDNVEDRKSTQLLDQATQLEVKANGLNQRATELRDSAETVKKKYREAIVIEADKLDKQAEELRVESADIRDKGNDLKTQEDELLSMQLDNNSENPNEDKLNELATSDDYKDIVAAQKSAQDNLDQANEIGEQIEQIKTQQKRTIKQAVVTYQDGGGVDAAVKDDPKVKEDQAKIDSLKAIQKALKDKAMQDMADVNNLLDKNGENKDDLVAMLNNDIAPKDKSTLPQVQDSLSADFEAPDVLVTDIFRTTNDPIYGQDKAIPMDQKTSGLVYKVQVGAFRKPLPQDHFKEFAPVSGQKLDNGVTRYMAGYFTKENTANNARGQIRGIGYGDAFVVAYCNGERITIAEARKIEAGEIVCEGTTNNENFTNNGGNQNNDNNGNNDNETNQNNGGNDNNAGNQNNGGNDNNDGNQNNGNDNNDNNTVNQNNGNNGNDVQPNNETEENLVSYYTNFPEAAKATQVEIVKGLFFTVQIGVYTKPVKPAVLFNIQPLNSQKLENGNIRYSTGKYTSVADATVRKNETVTIGVTDAFVTAYFNGERITISRANEILAEQGASALYNSPENAEANFSGSNPDTNPVDTTTVNPVDTTDTNPNDTTDQNPTTNNEKTGLLSDQTDGDTGPPYRVNLGYFQGEVPVVFTDKLLNNQDEGILSISDIQDNVLYFVGTYDSKDEAESRKAELISKGFNDAEIVSLIPDEPTQNEVVYYPEGVYYRILMGRYENEIPGEYATILLQTENLLETEQDVEGATYLMSTKINDFDEIQDKLNEFSNLGFEDMEIVSYYQYDPIPLLQAEKITNGDPIGKLQKYETPKGVSADPYLYNKDAIYFRIEVGKFFESVPGEFTELLFNNSEENILREETIDQEVIYHTENSYSYEETEQKKNDLIAKGFKDAKIIAFHKYDEISLLKALELLGIE